MSRKNAREDAFKLIFEASINEGGSEEQLGRYFEIVGKEYELFRNKPTGQDNVYVTEIINGVSEKKDELLKIIEPNLKEWKMDRISKVSLAAALLGLYEMLYMDDIPESVSINEAVEISKKYDGPEAGAFVNGILGAVSRNKS